MPDIAIQPIPAATPQAAAPNSPAASDAASEDSFHAALTREMSARQESPSRAEAKIKGTHKDLQKEDPQPDAPAAPVPDTVSTVPADPSATPRLAAGSFSEPQDGNTQSEKNDASVLPGAALIPVMQAMERGIAAHTPVNPEPVTALAAGSSSTAIKPGAATRHASALEWAPASAKPEKQSDAEAFNTKVQAQEFSARLEGNRAEANSSAQTHAAPEAVPQASNVQASVRLDPIMAPIPQVSASIGNDVGTAAWNKSLGQHIAWMVAGDHQTAELHLHPADLGPLQVVLSVENNQADLSFVSREPSVREAIQAAMPELKAMLAESGISLGQTHVGAESPKDQPQFDTPRQRAMRESEHATTDARSGTIPLDPRRRGVGLVDMFA